MARSNPENLRIKRQYLVWLKEAKGLTGTSLDKAAAAIDSFTDYAKDRSFKAFHSEQARAFKRNLERSTNPRTGRPISAATIAGTLQALKAFFKWLADQPGYKSRISHSDAEYFNPSHEVVQKAQARGWKPHPTTEQIEHVLRVMPTGTVLERRERAVIAFLFLTGCRDDAATTVRLRHVDLVEGCVHFDAREVRTKRSKSFSTWFFPVGKDAHQILADWVIELRQDHLWGPDDPLFPRTLVGVGNTGRFTAQGIDRAPWSGAGPIRKLFPAAFREAGLPSFNPHRVRDTLADLGNRLCKSPEEYKAWSQNLGHNHVMTTLMNYGSVATGRQAEIIKGFNDRRR
jgi:site-specific recombinase XerD